MGAFIAVLLKNRVEADKMGVSSGIRRNRPNRLCLLTSGETRLIGKSAYLVPFYFCFLDPSPGNGTLSPQARDHSFTLCRKGN